MVWQTSDTIMSGAHSNIPIKCCPWLVQYHKEIRCLNMSTRESNSTCFLCELNHPLDLRNKIYHKLVSIVNSLKYLWGWIHNVRKAHVLRIHKKRRQPYWNSHIQLFWNYFKFKQHVLSHLPNTHNSHNHIIEYFFIFL